MAHGMLERNASADLFRHTLSKVPTVLGRLEYLASLRDPNSGTYRHHGLAAVFGRDESKRALCAAHEEAYQEWLNLSLSQKKDDALEHLESINGSKPGILQHWQR